MEAVDSGPSQIMSNQRFIRGPSWPTLILLINYFVIEDFIQIANDHKMQYVNNYSDLKIYISSSCRQRGKNTVTSKSSLVGNHFVFAVYKPQQNRVLYVDTLGWPIADDFKLDICQFAHGLGLPQPEFVSVHSPHSYSFQIHKCNKNCAKWYPLQSCSSVCGVAVIIGVSIAVLNPSLFAKMVSTVPGDMNELPVGYLHEISHYSHYLRLVVIEWFMKNEINLSLIVQSSSELCMFSSPPAIDDHNHCKSVIPLQNIITQNSSDEINESIIIHVHSEKNPCPTKTGTPSQNSSDEISESIFILTEYHISGTLSQLKLGN